MFGLCQVYAFVEYLRSKLTQEQFEVLFKTVAVVVGAILSAAVAVTMALGSILLSDNSKRNLPFFQFPDSILYSADQILRNKIS